MMNIKLLLGSRSTFRALWKGEIPFEIEHIRDIETKVSKLYLCNFVKFGHEVFTECGKPGCKSLA